MRRSEIVLISAAIGGIATLWAIFACRRSYPIKLRVVGVEPRSMFYHGEKEDMLITLRISNSDDVPVRCEIAALEANVGGRSVEWHPVSGFPRTTPGIAQGGWLGAGAECEETVVIPGGTEACRVRLCYAWETRKSQYITRALARPKVLRWALAESRWLSKWIFPDPFESIYVPISGKSNTVEVMIPRKWPWREPTSWKSNTLEIMIPWSDRVFLPSAHNQSDAPNPAMLRPSQVEHP